MPSPFAAVRLSIAIDGNSSTVDPSGRHEQPVAAARVVDGVCIVFVADIVPIARPLDANRRRAVELELQQADAEVLAHLRDTGEQPRPVRLEIAQGPIAAATLRGCQP